MAAHEQGYCADFLTSFSFFIGSLYEIRCRVAAEGVEGGIRNFLILNSLISFIFH